MKIATFALGGLAGLAIFLAGLGSPPPAAAQPSPESSFTGPRVEMQAGWDQLGFDLADYGIDDTENESGLGYGLTVGYDVPIGSNLVGGIEATLGFSTTDDSFADSAGVAYGYETGRDLGLAARLGTRLGSSVLAYGKLGYSNLRLDVTSDDGTTVASDSVDLDGVLFGAGLEFGIGRHAFLKTEFSHTNYQDDVSRNRLTAGLGLRF